MATRNPGVVPTVLYKVDASPRLIRRYLVRADRPGCSTLSVPHTSVYLCTSAWRTGTVASQIPVPILLLPWRGMIDALHNG